MPVKRTRSRQVRVRLDPNAAHHVPSAGPHMRADTLEAVGVVSLYVLVYHRFAAQKCQCGILFHQSNHAAYESDSLVESFPQIPQPYRIEMTIGQ